MHEPRDLELRRYLHCQREVTAGLIDGETLEQVAPGFLAAVLGLLRWEAGAIWEVVEGSAALRFVHGLGVGGLDAAPLWKCSRELSFERGTGLPGRAWETAEIAWAPDFAENPSYPRGSAAAEVGLRAALALPVASGPDAEVSAVAEFHTRSFNTQSELLMDLLESFAEQLATFIDRRRTEAEIRSAEQFKAAVMSSALDSIVGMDERGAVIEFNAAAVQLFGYSREQALGRELADLLVPSHLRERHRAGLLRYLETGESKLIDNRTELPAQRRDGSIVPV